MSDVADISSTSNVFTSNMRKFGRKPIISLFVRPIIDIAAQNEYNVILPLNVCQITEPNMRTESIFISHVQCYGHMHSIKKHKFESGTDGPFLDLEPNGQKSA